jgi:hypothetical protein
MLKTNETITAPAKTGSAADATKDTGRVRYGAGCIHYSDATPAREATKDAGRVRYGAGCIQF